jgi:hypothetical protein
METTAVGTEEHYMEFQGLVPLIGAMAGVS